MHVGCMIVENCKQCKQRKQVVKDHLVDRWNSLPDPQRLRFRDRSLLTLNLRRGLNEQLIPGSVVTAVNGRRRKEESQPKRRQLEQN